jgi:hypothetical protein
MKTKSLGVQSEIAAFLFGHKGKNSKQHRKYGQQLRGMLNMEV